MFKIITKGCILSLKKTDTSKYIESTTTETNPEFQSVIVDESNNILWGKYTDGTETNVDLEGLTFADGESVANVVNLLKS